MRPSSPTGVGSIDGAPVLLLPGDPVSCLVAYDFFAGPVIRVMSGGAEAWLYPSVALPLSKRLVSQVWRTDYARVIVANGEVEGVSSKPRSSSAICAFVAVAVGIDAK